MTTMTAEKLPDSYARLTSPDTLTIQRLLPGPAGRIWDYLTRSDMRRLWFAAGDMEMTVGAPFELVWRNDELTDPPGQPPEGSGGEHRMKCRVIACDPPRKLVITWGENSEVAFMLEPRGDKVLLTLDHRRAPNRNVLLSVSTGWHAHLDLLVARMAGETPTPFWDAVTALRRDYEQRLSG